ncbi:MAG: hypothetical protein JO053_03945 [Acidobacteria bacterium]|nr:hypothetical protein [Acidobacteriota bacterium]
MNTKIRKPVKFTAFELVEDSTELIRSLVGRVAAGSPLEVVGDEERMDLNYLVSRSHHETMIIRVEGDSMCPEIGDGDHVVVALGRSPQPGEIVIAKVDGGYTVKKFRQREFRLYLVPSNAEHDTRELHRGDQILGVVTFILKKAA